MHDDIAPFYTVVGSMLATSSPDGTLAVSDWETGHTIWKHKLGEPYERIKGKDVGRAVFALTACDGKVVAGTTDGKLWVYEIETGYVSSPWS